MQYLVRLVTPKGETILDPFMGSGSTGKAVAYENNDRNADYSFIGIELNPEYCDIAERRIEFARKDKSPLIESKQKKQQSEETAKLQNKLF
jgi:site-specific DNA-methyltransferase (adenine-specific)